MRVASLILVLTVSSYVQGGMRGEIYQAARTNERVKSLELQTIPDLHIGGVSGSPFMIHILPLNDLKEHEELTTCECKPRIEILDDGEIMVVHNSYDGREYIEELVSNINNN